MISKTDAAYLAGYIDGDGCLSISKQISRGGKIHHGARIAVASVVPEPLYKFQEIFGGSVTDMHVTSLSFSVRGYRPVEQWRLVGLSCEPLLLAIRPYTIIKKAQLEVLLEFIAAGTSYSRWDLPPPHVLKKREELYLQMRVLNRVGIFNEKVG